MSEPTLYLLAIAAAWALVCFLGWLVRKRLRCEIRAGDIITVHENGILEQYRVTRVVNSTTLIIEPPYRKGNQ